jgi:hypothetical protein
MMALFNENTTMGGLCNRNSGGDEASVSKLTVGKDYHEVPDQFVGQGIKKTPAWLATVTPEQLNIARQEFWSTRTTGHPHIWTAIRSAVEADAETGAMILQMTEIALLNNCIASCRDSEQVLYSVPYFVINDPVKFVDPSETPKPKKAVPAFQALSLKVRVMPVQRDCRLEVESGSSVGSLKAKYLETPNAVGTMKTLKFYFAGREMHEAETLATYNITTDCVVQGLIRG